MHQGVRFSGIHRDLAPVVVIGGSAIYMDHEVKREQRTLPQGAEVLAIGSVNFGSLICEYHPRAGVDVSIFQPRRQAVVTQLQNQLRIIPVNILVRNLPVYVRAHSDVIFLAAGYEYSLWLRVSLVEGIFREQSGEDSSATCGQDLNGNSRIETRVGHRCLEDSADHLELVRNAAGRFLAPVAGHDEMRRAKFYPGLNLLVLLIIFLVVGSGGRVKNS